MKTPLRFALAAALAVFPLSSALACGGDFSESDAVHYAVQNRVLLGSRMSARSIRAQALAKREAAQARKAEEVSMGQ